MKIIICGSRTLTEDRWGWAHLMLDRLTANLRMEELVVLSGHAQGADRCGEEWCFRRRVTYEVYHAEWDRLGKKAGMVRNAEMVESAGKGAALIAFHDGKSPGTKSIMEMARKAGLKVKVVKFKVGKANVVNSDAQPAPRKKRSRPKC